MSTDFLHSAWNKIEIAKRYVLAEFPTAVALAVMGSITREATDSSDLDVSVVYLDHEYNERLEDIRDKLDRIAAEINAQYPKNELVLWASKADHYRTLLPDVSYVRRNLPYSLNRLDAWCGLAKLTLAFYEAASAKLIYGALDPHPQVQKIPRYEAVELFLVATRCLAEGLSEVAHGGLSERRKGLNHLAKAGLRAAYALLIATDGLPRNSYREILHAATPELPRELQPVLARLYDTKLGVQKDSPAIVEILQLMQYCEKRVAVVRRLSFSGVTWGRAGESFAYSSEIFTDSPEPIELYSRFAGYDVNFVHSMYFLLTGQEIIHRITPFATTCPEVLEFFFEEIVAVATFAFYNPTGISMQVGMREKTEVKLKLGLEVLESVAPLLSTLGTWHLGLAHHSLENQWLDENLRMNLLQILAMQLSTVSQLGNDRPTPSQPQNEPDLDGFCRAIQWQAHLLRGLYSEQLLDQLNKLALILYQAGRLEDAQSIVQEALRIDELKKDLETRVLTGPRVAQLRSLLSRTHQYCGVIHHRKGDLAAARAEYVRALELDSDNFSALDDVASLLMKTVPNEATAQFLSDLAGKSVAKRKESRNQITAWFMRHAIDLKQQGKYEEARFWYERMIDLDPQSATAHHNFALLFEAMKYFEGAIVQYEKSLELNNKYTNAYIGLGRLLESSGKDAEAVQVLSRAIHAGAADERVWTNLGNIHLKNHDLELARNCYETAASLNPGFADAWNGMGATLISIDNPSAPVLWRALHCFEKAIDADPSFEGAMANYLRMLRLLQSNHP